MCFYVLQCATSEQARRELVLDVAGRPEPYLGLQPAGPFQLQRVLSDPAQLQLALLPWGGQNLSYFTLVN